MRERSSENFTPPEPILSANPALNGGYAGEIKVKIDKDSGKLATNKTPPQKIEEKTFRETHTILHYVNKNNPQGGQPEHSEEDPQYQNWESAIQKWLLENPAVADTQSKPPTEYDDIHTDENKPIITITNPQNYSVAGNEISVKTNIFGRFPVKEVDFFVNNILVSSDFKYPFETTITLSGVELGEIIITARAYDKYDNVGEASVLVFK